MVTIKNARAGLLSSSCLEDVVFALFYALFTTLQDIFIRFEMWRFSENSAIFSDRQNFGRCYRIRHIIFKLILITVASPLHIASEK